MVQFVPYLSCVLDKMRLIFSRINGRNVCFEKKTVSFKDQYTCTSIFLRQMEATVTVFIILQIFFAASGTKLFTNSLLSKTFTAWDLDFSVFHGTTL